jgi:predicted O-methyltransferase YrrM
MRITTTVYEKLEIRRHVIELRARRILEVGAFKGKTTALLSELAAAHDGQVVVIDPMIWRSNPAHVGEWIHGFLHPFRYEKAFWRNVNAAGFANVRLIPALSTDVALIENPDRDLAEFDLVFIDGDHTHATVMQDIANWGSRIRSGGRMLLHDAVRRFDGVVRAMRCLEKDENVSVTWPTRGKVGVVDILGRIDRSRYLDAVGVDRTVTPHQRVCHAKAGATVQLRPLH